MTPAIRIRGVSCSFGSRVEVDGAERPREAWRELLRIAGIDAASLRDFNTERTISTSVHALRDISLDIDHGSVVCLTGPSGSGKSVLLQILAGATPPTSGRVEIWGTVASLLTTGGDLDARLTAEENIEASPDYAAAGPDAAARYLQDVIEFAELQGFERTLLRTYSTGMLMRLGVALVLCGSASIVLIDDVLAVGDIGFQHKVADRIHALKNAGRTLVLALSDEEMVAQLATRVITLNSGRVAGDVVPQRWVGAPRPPGVGEVHWQVREDLPEDDVMSLAALDVRRPESSDQLELTMTFQAKTGGIRCRPSVFLLFTKAIVLRTVAPEFTDVAGERRMTWTVHLPLALLPDGRYSLWVNMQTVRDDLVYAMKAQDAVVLTIRRSEPAEEPSPTPSILLTEFPWEVEQVGAPA